MVLKIVSLNGSFTSNISANSIPNCSLVLTVQYFDQNFVFKNNTKNKNKMNNGMAKLCILHFGGDLVKRS